MSIVSLPTLLQCHDSLLVLVLEKDIGNAIVIVLPYLTDTQRQATQATRDAITITSIKMECIIKESTTAAIVNGMHKISI